MKNLDLFNQERLKKNEMKNVHGGGLPGPYYGIQTPGQPYLSSCGCIAWCNGDDKLLFDHGDDVKRTNYNEKNYR